jgi:acyl transferase domain-containing protein
MAEERNYSGFEVAIIGMSGVFPGANDIRRFWENLAGGVESVSFFSEEEAAEMGVPPEILQNPNFVRSRGGIVEDIDCFDASFFQYTPNEAEVMDPQIRVFHQCAWNALEDAGYDPFSYEGLIGLYAGASRNLDWQARLMMSGKMEDLGDFAASHLADRDYLNSRIAYQLNLKGPVVFLHTACSTSLTAIHLACRGLLMGECHMALAGGVSISTGGASGYIYQEGMIPSPDGHCRPFDAQAKGTVRGNGAGVVVLRRLKHAMASKDHIYAMIKGSAINNDGNRKVGFTAPSVEGQAEVVRTVQHISKVEPNTVSYIETHGTGTVLGDPIEIEALKKAFNIKKTGSCRIGSVKANIGHLDTAAGVTGVIKTVLALVHRKIPPSINFSTPNPRIDFDSGPFVVSQTLHDWIGGGSPLRAGVSSFGIGGTNAHLVLEEAPQREVASSKREVQLIVVSAHTEEALQQRKEQLIDYLDNHEARNPADVCYTLQVGRRPFPYRFSTICAGVEEAKEALRQEGGVSFVPEARKRKPPAPVFMFPGQGAQYAGMGKELYQQEAVFRRELDTCFRFLDSLGAGNLRDALFPSDGAAEDGGAINRTACTQPVLFSFEYALARQLMAWGIEPAAMIGHSIGEYVAACLAGVFSLEEALTLVAARGKLMQDCPEGDMLSVAASVSQCRHYLGTDICIAAINSPYRTVLSGEATALERLRRQLEDNGIECSVLHTSHAFHSYLMEPMMESFLEVAANVTFNEPQIPFISNLNGAWIGPAEATDPHYWWRHAREAVNFSAGVSTLLEMENPVFIEVGPGRTLKTLLRQHIQGKEPCNAIDLIKHPRVATPGYRYFSEGLGHCWAAGIPIDWQAYHEGEERRRVPLPGYPFAKTKYWLDRVEFDNSVEMVQNTPPDRKLELEDFFYIPLWNQTPVPEEVAAEKEKGNNPFFILFIDDSTFAGVLRDLCVQQGGLVITVKAGDTFRKTGETDYTVAPVEADHYRRLWRDINPGATATIHVVHLWSLAVEDNGEQMFDAGYFSLLYLTQAIAASPAPGSLTLTFVSNQCRAVTGAEDLALSPAPAVGLLKVIPQETAGLKTRHIDLQLPATEGFLARALINDIVSDSNETTVAYRNRTRYVEVFKPAPLQEGDSVKEDLLREGGVYLITGGLGKIGLRLARWLAQSKQAKLALVTRSSLPLRDQPEEWLREMEACEAQVSVYTADVADAGQMETTVQAIEKELGPITGVFHAAGVTGGKSAACMLGDITKGDVVRQFQAKAHGTMVLGRLLKDRPLDFCVLFSSLSSILGGIGFGAYAAGNRFMDSFAHKKFIEDSPFPWISVNWDGWDFASGQELALSPEEGLEALRRVVNWRRHPQVAVSTWDMEERIRQWIDMEILRQPDEGDSPEESVQDRDVEYIQQTVIEIWRRLLGIEDIAPKDHFFDLGGDSLKIMTVASNIHKRLHVEIPIAELFNRPTPEAIARYIHNTAQADFEGIRPQEKRDYYDVSHAQKRLWVIDQFSQEQGAYKVSLSYSLGNLDVDCFVEAFNALIRRHEILRTTFMEVEGQPRQRIHPFDECGIKIESVDYSEKPDGEEQAVALAQKDYRIDFDLTAGPLVRAKLVRLAGDQFLFLLTLHHIIADAWSVDVLQNELTVIYDAFSKGEEIPLKGLDIHYKDYSVWQNNQIGGETFRRHKQFWTSLFQDGSPIMDMQTDFSRPPVKSIKGNNVMVVLDRRLGQAVRSVCQRHECSLFMMLVSTAAVLLYYYSGQEDMVIGSPIAGRDHGDLEEQIGFYLNMLPLRISFSDSDSFAALLEHVKQLAIEAFQHQAYPFDLLINDLEVNRDSSRSPLFDVVVQVLNTAAPARETSAGDSGDEPLAQSFQVELKQSKYDLVFNFSENGGFITLNLEYNIDLFKLETIELMARRFEMLMKIVTEDERINIADIQLEEEYSIPTIRPVRR